MNFPHKSVQPKFYVTHRFVYHFTRAGTWDIWAISHDLRKHQNYIKIRKTICMKSIRYLNFSCNQWSRPWLAIRRNAGLKQISFPKALFMLNPMMGGLCKRREVEMLINITKIHCVTSSCAARTVALISDCQNRWFAAAVWCRLHQPLSWTGLNPAEGPHWKRMGNVAASNLGSTEPSCSRKFVPLPTEGEIQQVF